MEQRQSLHALFKSGWTLNSPIPSSINIESLSKTLTWISSLGVDEIESRNALLLISKEKEMVFNPLKTLVSLLYSPRNLQCKAANALGTLCMNTEIVFEIVSNPSTIGNEMMDGLIQMLKSDNYWAHGDACYVLGWIAAYAKHEQISNEMEESLCLTFHHVVALLETYLPCHQTSSIAHFHNLFDKQMNFRIYALVFILNITASSRSMIWKQKEDRICNDMVWWKSLLSSLRMLILEEREERDVHEEESDRLPLILAIVNTCAFQSDVIRTYLTQEKWLALLIATPSVMAQDAGKSIVQRLIQHSRSTR